MTRESEMSPDGGAFCLEEGVSWYRLAFLPRILINTKYECTQTSIFDIYYNEMIIFWYKDTVDPPSKL